MSELAAHTARTSSRPAGDGEPVRSLNDRLAEVLVVHPEQSAKKSPQLRTDFDNRFNDLISSPETAALKFNDAEIPRLVEMVAKIAASDPMNSFSASSFGVMARSIAEDPRVGMKAMREAFAEQILGSEDPKATILQLSTIPGRVVTHALLETAIQARAAGKADIESAALNELAGRYEVVRGAEPMVLQLLRDPAASPESKQALLYAAGRQDSVSPEMLRELNQRFRTGETQEIVDASAAAIAKFAPSAASTEVARAALSPAEGATNVPHAGSVAIALAERGDNVGLSSVLNALRSDSKSGLSEEEKEIVLIRLYEKHASLSRPNQAALEKALTESLPVLIVSEASDIAKVSAVATLARAGGSAGLNALDVLVEQLPERSASWKAAVRELGYKGHAPKSEAGMVELNELLSIGSHLDVTRRATWMADAAVDADRRSAIVGSSRVDLQACKLEYSIVSPK